jgi:hypothetical protein
MRGFWRTLVVFLVGGILGTGFGVALGFFLFPFVFPPPPLNEQLTQADVAPLQAAAPAAPAPVATAPAPADAAPSAAPSQPAPSQATAAAPAPQAPAAPVPVAKGTFIHANPSDPVHWGRGKVSAYERTIFLEPDFEVGPGPKYHVYLVPKASVRREADVTNAMYVDLGRLRAFKGSQRYPIPDGVDIKKYASVVIWCERFGVLISPADLAMR